MKKALCLMVLVAWALCGADQVGTVSGTGLTLRGNAVPGTAQSLPVMSGDGILTSTAPAALILADKSSITIQANAQLWVERQGSRIVLCMSKGSLQFSTPPGSQVRVCALGRPVDLTPSSDGTVSIEAGGQVRAVTSRGSVNVAEGATCSCAAMPPAAAAGWSTTKKVAVVAALAGGSVATTAIVLAVRDEPTPVSPSRP